MFHNLEAILLSFINTIPLEIFVFVASFIEEVIAPIPSSGVLLVTGSFATLQGLTLFNLLPITLIAASGKTLGAVIVYFFSDKIGDLMITKFGRFFDITHESIQEFSSKITGGPRDYLMLTIFRALPILPSSVVSVGCGLLEIPRKLFIITTFIGTLVRDSIFLYIGFKGTEILSTFANQTTSIESKIQAAFILAIIIGLGYLYFKRRKQTLVGKKV